MSSVPWIFGDGGTNLGVGLIPVHSFSLHPASHIKVQFICISASGRCLSELDVLRVATFVRGCVKAFPSIDRRCCLRWSPRCGGPLTSTVQLEWTCYGGCGSKLLCRAREITHTRDATSSRSANKPAPQGSLADYARYPFSYQLAVIYDGRRTLDL